MVAPEISKSVNKGGRPTKYTPDKLDSLLDDYITDCKSSGAPVLITSFAIYAKVDRSTLQDYAAKEEFSPIIKRLEDACEDCAVRYLYSGKNPAGVIFYLKNKHGWTDKQEINHTGTVTHQLADGDWQEMERRVIEARQRRMEAPVVDAEYTINE